MDEHEVIVLDYGHTSCKFGVAGDDTPLGQVATYAKYYGGEYNFLPHEGQKTIHGPTDPYFDDLRFSFSGMEIQDYDLFIQVIQFCNETFLKGKATDPKNMKILINSLPPHHPEKMKQKMTEICMEYFGFNSILFSDQNTCSTYSSGRTSSMSLCVGGGQTSLFFLYEGYSIDKFTFQQPWGGHDMNFKLYEILSRKRKNIVPFAPTFVNLNSFMSELKIPPLFNNNNNMEDEEQKLAEFVLPDNTKIEFTPKEVKEMSDVLFKGEQQQQQQQQQQAIAGLETIIPQKLDKIKEFRIHDFILSGGVPNMHGFSDRIREILDKYSENSLKNAPKGKNSIEKRGDWRVVSPPEKVFSTWIGGSILGSLSTSQKMFMNHEDLLENSSSSSSSQLRFTL